MPGEGQAQARPTSGLGMGLLVGVEDDIHLFGPDALAPVADCKHARGIDQETIDQRTTQLNEARESGDRAAVRDLLMQFRKEDQPRVNRRVSSVSSSRFYTQYLLNIAPSLISSAQQGHFFKFAL